MQTCSRPPPPRSSLVRTEAPVTEARGTLHKSSADDSGTRSGGMTGNAITALMVMMLVVILADIDRLTVCRPAVAAFNVALQAGGPLWSALRRLGRW